MKSKNSSFCNLSTKCSNKEKSRFLILPVSYDETTTYRPGTRFGPQAIIDSSKYLELYDHELKDEFFSHGIYTLPFIESTKKDPKNIIDKIYKTAVNNISKNNVLISIGGEHSITIGLVKAAKNIYNDFSILQFDAHADLRDSLESSKYNHGCVARRNLEVSSTTLIGTRSLSKEEADFIDKNNVKVFWDKEAINNSKQVLSSLTQNVYISIDVDILDPSIMPATGTPEPNGWLWKELVDFLNIIVDNKNIVALDITEFSPISNNIAADFSIAKLIYKLIGFISKSKQW